MSYETDPTQATHEAISFGQHAEELRNQLEVARSDQLFTPMLVRAGVLPHDFSGSKVIPALLYGVEVMRPERFDIAEVLPGSASILADSIGTDNFNPHNSLRARGHDLVDTFTGKGKSRLKGHTFGMPAYVFEKNGDTCLFVGGTDDDFESLSDDLLKTVAERYGFTGVVLGGAVRYGDEFGHRLEAVSVPTLIRELGQNILHLSGATSNKVKMLEAAQQAHQEGRSPDYRPYLRLMGR